MGSTESKPQVNRLHCERCQGSGFSGLGSKEGSVAFPERPSGPSARRREDDAARNSQ